MSETKNPDLGALRQKLALIERGGRGETPVLPFGVPVLDGALPGGGLALGALHEIGGFAPAEEDGAEGAAFLAGILARLEPSRPVLWCHLRGDLHAPGLVPFGLAPERLMLAQAGTEAELLWAMEEGLQCRALAAVVGELDGLSLTASRRLQLAAESSGITAFALRRRRHAAPVGADEQPTAAATRWRIAALPSRLSGEPGLGLPLWHIELLRVRGGRPGRWPVESCDATGHVRLAAAPAADQPRRAAG
ncbi:MAG TPA: damage-inducible protein [Stellaceae bacterium]|nr:damage-inducible protein [Stellaceae bacterium]